MSIEYPGVNGENFPDIGNVLGQGQLFVLVVAHSLTITQWANPPAGLISGIWLSGDLWERGDFGVLLTGVPKGPRNWVQ